MKLKLILFLVLPFFIFAQRVTVDKVIGKVDNYIILQSEVEQIYSRANSQGEPISKCQSMQTMLINKMLVAKSEIDSVKLEDKDLTNALDGRMAQMIQQFGSEKNIVEAYGKSIDQFKSELRGQVREQLLAQEMQTTIQKSVKMTPKEVKRFFNAIPKDSLPYISTEVEIAHIVRFATVKKALKDELRTRLLSYRERILKGESFAKLAGEFSEDPGSKNNGGLYLNTKRGMFDPKYEAAVFKIKAGEMTGVVESEFGFHLIKLEEMKGQEYSSRHILLRPDYNRLDLSDAKAYMDSLYTRLQADSVKFEKVAKTESQDLTTNDVGGVISDMQSGEPKMALDASMDPNLFFLINDMKIGEMTKPLEYRTEDGKTGMRIVKLVKKFDSHTINFRDDYQKIANIALENKKNTVMDDWFKKAVKDVFIKVDPEYEGCQIFGLSNN
jgi:peptidyl-prolyl cis-trans isomerase SurA